MLEIEQIGAFSEKVKWSGKVHALIVRSNPNTTGYNFISHPDDSMQLAVNQYNQGSCVKPHYHLPQERSIGYTAEFIHIDSGYCRMSLYSLDLEKYYETFLGQGDTVLFLDGGHSFEMIEPTRIIEVKQGPYHGPEKDKVVFEDRKAYE